MKGIQFYQCKVCGTECSMRKQVQSLICNSFFLSRIISRTELVVPLLPHHPIYLPVQPCIPTTLLFFWLWAHPLFSLEAGQFLPSLTLSQHHLAGQKLQPEKLVRERERERERSPSSTSPLWGQLIAAGVLSILQYHSMGFLILYFEDISLYR